MIEVPVRSAAGEVLRQLQLDERVWGLVPNTAVLHQAVVAQLANQRKGTHSTKTRGEVAGGGRKPWRQKGTGRARQGSTRAPHWRGGGIVFGPRPRSYHKDLPRKMRRLALRSALSAKVQDGELIVVEALSLPAPKTREMAATLDKLGASGSALIVLGGPDEQVKRAAANLPKVRTVAPGSTNLLDVLNHRWLLMTVDAIETITQTLSAGLREAAPARGDGAAAPASAAPATPTASSAPSAGATASEAGAAPSGGAAPAIEAAPAPGGSAAASSAASASTGPASAAPAAPTSATPAAGNASAAGSLPAAAPNPPPASPPAQPPTQESAP
jgi:large subunit ribosomal protein L4